MGAVGDLRYPNITVQSVLAKSVLAEACILDDDLSLESELGSSSGGCLPD